MLIQASLIWNVLSANTTTGRSLVVTETLVVDQIDQMIEERTWRAQASAKSARSAAMPPISTGMLPVQTSLPIHSTPKLNTNAQSSAASATNTKSATAPKSDPSSDDDDGPHSNIRLPKKDAGVADEVWRQLQEDSRNAEEEEKERKRLEK
jgi:hypothetical protein